MVSLVSRSGSRVMPLISKPFPLGCTVVAQYGEIEARVSRDPRAARLGQVSAKDEGNIRRYKESQFLRHQSIPSLTFTFALTQIHQPSPAQRHSITLPLHVYLSYTKIMTKTVAFLGASTGVGLSALKRTLTAGHQALALCRTPSKLSSILPAESNPGLRIVEGNAHDIDAVCQILKKEDGTLVDEIVSTIGGKPILTKLSIDDPDVCRKGMAVLLDALAQLRSQGATGRPLIVAFSTTGMSRFGRDIPILMIPLYHVLLKVPHEDKRVMEDKLAESGEEFVIVRASLLVDGETDKAIRVGIEDPKTGRESDAIGYTISREDCGKWVAENLLLKREEGYSSKIVTITN